MQKLIARLIGAQSHPPEPRQSYIEYAGMHVFSFHNTQLLTLVGLVEPILNDSVLPVELFEYFLQYLPQDQLAKVCLVSRLFNREATNILYQNMDLQGSTAYQLQSWSVCISEHEDLAQKARTLILPNKLAFDNIFKGDYTKWHSDLTLSVSRAMHMLLHLDSLCILSCKERYGGTSCYMKPEILLGCAFRLHTFRSEGLEGADWAWRAIETFLKQQDRIRDWQCDNTTLVSVNDSKQIHGAILDVLPCLSIAHIAFHHETIFLRTVALRQLTQLRLDILGNPSEEEWTQIIMILSSCGQTLTHFHLQFNWQNQSLESEHVQRIQDIARFLPNVEFLYYAEPMDTAVGHIHCHPSIQILIGGAAGGNLGLVSIPTRSLSIQTTHPSWDERFQWYINRTKDIQII